MNFSFSDRVIEFQDRLERFMDAHVYANTERFNEEIECAKSRYAVPPLLAELKEMEKSDGPWNLLIPEEHRSHGGAGLSNIDYAPLAEIMGCVLWAPEVFNCNATGI